MRVFRGLLLGTLVALALGLAYLAHAQETPLIPGKGADIQFLASPTQGARHVAALRLAKLPDERLWVSVTLYTEGPDGLRSHTDVQGWAVIHWPLTYQHDANGDGTVLANDFRSLISVYGRGWDEAPPVPPEATLP